MFTACKKRLAPSKQVYILCVYQFYCAILTPHRKELAIILLRERIVSIKIVITLQVSSKGSISKPKKGLMWGYVIINQKKEECFLKKLFIFSDPRRSRGRGYSSNIDKLLRSFHHYILCQITVRYCCFLFEYPLNRAYNILLFCKKLEYLSN